MPTSPAPAPTAAQRFSPDTIPQSASQEGPVLLAMKPADASRASLSESGSEPIGSASATRRWSTVTT
jgi:hypothetical protein